MKKIEVNPHRSKKHEIPFKLTYFDLRALLFWASVGIAKSNSGSYSEAAMHPGDMGIVKDFADHIKFPLPCKPQFGSAKKKS